MCALFVNTHLICPSLRPQLNFLHGMAAGQTVSTFRSAIFFSFMVASKLHINLFIKLCPLDDVGSNGGQQHVFVVCLIFPAVVLRNR